MVFSCSVKLYPYYLDCLQKKPYYDKNVTLCYDASTWDYNEEEIKTL